MLNEDEIAMQKLIKEEIQDQDYDIYQFMDFLQSNNPFKDSSLSFLSSIISRRFQSMDFAIPIRRNSQLQSLKLPHKIGNYSLFIIH